MATIQTKTTVVISRYFMVLFFGFTNNKREICPNAVARIIKMITVLKKSSVSMNSQIAVMVTRKPIPDTAIPVREKSFSPSFS
uniref:SCO family protein n=1 Tax=Sinomicrobium pectinilyticum TaxID=1084421 RepID=UPI0037440286